MPVGSSVGGAMTRTRCVEGVQAEDVRARHAAVGDVAADGDRSPVHVTLGAADRQRVEQRLGRVLVPAVAGVQHRAVHLLRQQGHGARTRVAHDQQVGPHRVQRQGGVDERLALLHRGGLQRHVHHVGAEPLAGQLEARHRPGRRLEEQVDLRQATQRRLVPRAPAVQLDIVVGTAEDPADVLGRQRGDPQEMVVLEHCGPRNGAASKADRRLAASRSLGAAPGAASGPRPPQPRRFCRTCAASRERPAFS